jgi:para-aminobenzoate synthetase component 1
VSDRGAIVSALHVNELAHVPDPLALLEELRPDGLPWLLDSALPNPSTGRFSFVGADPYWVLRVRGDEAGLECRRPVRPVPENEDPAHSDPFARVRGLLPPVPATTAGAARFPVPFVGGVVGYWGYELAQHITSLGASFDAIDGPSYDSPYNSPYDSAYDSAYNRDLPDLALLFVDRLVAIDHLEGRAWALGTGFATSAEAAGERAAAVCAEIASRASLVDAGRPGDLPGPEPPPRALVPAPDGLEMLFTEQSYAEAVSEIGEEIAAGNVYQANLTHRMSAPLEGVDPLVLYRVLREINPAPFAGYLELPEVAILSSSPERFVQVDAQRRVESRPIKGTRPRGATPEEDRRLAAELRESAKDRAENLMIVDLVRNDLGRVCETGSIDVPELMAIEPYATVHQMVSTVTGRLRADCDVVDLVQATFPPGSMTGAPKRAAMTIIERLEPVRRGVYSGAFGYLDARGGSDLSVVIRTLIVAGERAYLHVGGGIVADSEPAAEYRETLDKARALLAALARMSRAAGAAASSG